MSVEKESLPDSTKLGFNAASAVSGVLGSFDFWRYVFERFVLRCRKGRFEIERMKEEKKVISFAAEGKKKRRCEAGKSTGCAVY